MSLSDKVLLHELFPVRTKWYDIGLMLGVRMDILDNIRQSETYDVGRCLRMMLGYAPGLTWKRIVDALKSVAVSEERLAITLSEKYCAEGI